MKAILKEQRSNGKNLAQSKETTQAWHLIGYKKGQFKDLITMRWYMGRSNSASTVYCSVWIHGDGFYTAGHGQAGGWGYHKYSAAAGSAFTSAGVELYGSPYGRAEDVKRKCDIGGVGDSAVEEALKAIGKALGYNKTMIVRG